MHKYFKKAKKKKEEKAFNVPCNLSILSKLSSWKFILKEIETAEDEKVGSNIKNLNVKTYFMFRTREKFPWFLSLLNPKAESRAIFGWNVTKTIFSIKLKIFLVPKKKFQILRLVPKYLCQKKTKVVKSD